MQIGSQTGSQIGSQTGGQTGAQTGAQTGTQAGAQAGAQGPQAKVKLATARTTATKTASKAHFFIAKNSLMLMLLRGNHPLKPLAGIFKYRRSTSYQSHFTHFSQTVKSLQPVLSEKFFCFVFLC